MPHDDASYRSFFENSADAMLIIVDGEFVGCNAAAVAMLGYDRKDEIVHRPPFKLSPERQPDGCLSAEKAAEMIRIAEQQGSHRFEWDHLRKDGSVIPVEVSLTAVRTNGETHLHTIWRDISHRRQAEKGLRDSEERFRGIFETIPDPVILARLDDGTIIDVNAAFTEASGIPRLEALGHNSLQLGLWRESGMRAAFREQLQAHGAVRNFEADFKIRCGQPRTGLVSSRAIEVMGTACMLIVIRDVTAQKVAERALRDMNRIKSDFISTAAHELSTPLAAIIGFAELLLDPDGDLNLSEENRRISLQGILERGESLNRMIHDFLDITRIESGLPIPVTPHDADLAALVRKTVEHYRLRETRHSFELILPEKTGRDTLEVDGDRIGQVVENLLSNAVKYSPLGGRITVSGRVLTDGWEISVADRGIGMTEEQLARVFDRFYRADDSNAGVPGLGLGMSIVKHIVEAHGGTVRAESVLGEGTTVRVFIPSAPLTPPSSR